MSSVIPSAGTGCEASGGGYLNALDVFTGTSPTASGGGSGSSSFFDVDGDGAGGDEGITDSGGTGLVDADGNPLVVGSIDLGIGMPTESSQIDDPGAGLRFGWCLR